MRRVLVSLGALSLLVGLGVSAHTFRSHERSYWMPASAALPLVAGGEAELGFEPDEDGYWALEIAVDDDVGDAGRRLIVMTREDSELEIEWEVASDDGAVASGNAKAYLYVRRGSPALVPTLVRVALREPFGRNDSHWTSFGLAGATTHGRGIGRFRTARGKSYRVRVRSGADYGLLERFSPRLIVRREPRQWQLHDERTRSLHFFGLGALVLGAALLLAARIGPFSQAKR